MNVFKGGAIQQMRFQVRNELILNSAVVNKNDIHPRVHGVVYDAHTGILTPIHVDFSHHANSMAHIYGLYPTV